MNNIVTCLRHIIFWERPNNDKVTNELIEEKGYVKNGHVTTAGFKYLTQKLKPRCVVSGCWKPHFSKSFCNTHFHKYYRGLRGEELLEIEERVSDKLILLLERVCRNSVPIDISNLRNNGKFMSLVEEGLKRKLLYYKSENMLQITPDGLDLLD